MFLVGAGPGDLGLVTLRAKQCIEEADVIVYDSLANPEMLGWARSDAEIIYAGKRAGEHTLAQSEINGLLISKATEGKSVVRLKGGDPFIFGRGAEEAQAVVEAGLRFEIVPGISSAVAGPAYAGIPVTHRGQNSHFTVFTGHEDPTKPGSAIDFNALAQLGAVQVWANARKDQAGSVRQYRHALSLGGTRPLPELFEAAGARFAFDVETLREAVSLIEATIESLTG